MPKYYYNVDGKGIPELDGGEVFENDEAAWHEATLVAGRYLRTLMAPSARAKRGV
jgi:hypothetical protein